MPLYLYGVIISLIFAAALNAEELFDINEIKPGLKGEWKTDIGSEGIQSFGLEIIGVLPNFTGPGRSIIVAQAIDPVNILSGPVAGMSGSPVYIEGKLVGAYAYGYIWPKEQAIIGITPIQDMLEMWNIKSAGGSSDAIRSLSTSDSSISPLPTALTFSGFSSQTLDLFSDQWTQLGISQMSTGASSSGGSQSVETVASTLLPGSAMAAVLMTGDFSAAATGTVTWREGDRVLGFGHPFLQWGSVAMPMATADVVSVVRNLRQSFKLSKIGPVVGTLTHDRLTGVSGVIGDIPRMAEIELELHAEGHDSRIYKSQAFPDERIFPLLSGMVLAEALGQGISASIDRTIHVQGVVEFEGFEPVEFEDVASGPDGIGSVATDLFMRMQRIQLNGNTPVDVNSLKVKVTTIPRNKERRLVSVSSSHRAIYPGQNMSLNVEWQDWRNGYATETVRVDVPATLMPGDTYDIVVGNDELRSYLSGLWDVVSDDPEQLLDAWRKEEGGSGFWVMFLPSGRETKLRGQLDGTLPTRAKVILSGTENLMPFDFVVPLQEWFSSEYPFYGAAITKVKVVNPYN